MKRIYSKLFFAITFVMLFSIQIFSQTITTTGTFSNTFENVFPGNYSRSQSFTVSATGLTANLVVTAPSTDFQVSLACNSGFGSSVSLTPSGGTVSVTPIYVRFTPQTIGTKSGNITCSSTGATSKTIALSEVSTASNLPGTYYNTATGTGATLKTNLYNIIKGHTTVSYTGLWTAYSTTDIRPDGKIWDMYSDIPCGTPVVNFTYSTDQCGVYSVEGDCYNREHSFPNSWFGTETNTTSEGNIAYTDLHHVFPTDGKVNGMRANNVFGEVTAPTYTSSNGSKLGPNNISGSGYTGTVFEPIDDYKGDFARAYFYMVTRYQPDMSAWQAITTEGNVVMDGTTYPSIEPWVLQMLINWHNADPVDQKELSRNDVVYTKQNNRNPYIDHPEYVAAVWVTSPTITATPTSLSNFSYVSGFGPSASQTFELSGINFTGTGNVTVSGSTNYEVSTDGTTFASSVTYPYASGVITGQPKTVYVRLKSGLTIGAYNSQNIAISGGGATTVNVSCSGDVTTTPSVVLSDNGTQIGVGNASQNITNYILHKTSLAVSSANATLSGLQVTTTGNYAASDLTNLKVRFSLDASLDAGDVTLSTYTNPGTAGAKTFPSFSSQFINSGTTGYIFITCDLSVTATVGNTIGVDAITTSQITIAGATKSGSSTNGGLQTITSFIPANVFISEYSGSGYLADFNDEYFELTNNGGAAQDLTGWTLEYYNSTDVLEGGAQALTGSIAANSTYLIAARSTGGTINGLTPDFVCAGIAMNSTGYVILKDASTAIVDQAGSTTNKFADGKNYEFTDCTSDNLPTANWTDLGTGNGTPGVVNCITGANLTATPSTLTGFSYVFGAGPSTQKTFNISGVNLDASDVTITPPADYEISTTSGSGFVSTPITLTAFDGTSTAIYVRLKAGLSISAYNSENIAISGGGASNINVSCSGDVLTIPDPSLSLSPTSLSGFSYNAGSGPSSSQTYYLSGSYLTGYPGDITITGSTNYEVSTDNITFTSSTTVAYTSATLNSTPIYVRLKAGLTVGAYNSENITNAGGGAITQNVTCNGNVNTSGSPENIFVETMGTVAATTLIPTHETNNGFDNDGYTMTGSGDVRITTASNTYTGASGSANIFLTNTVGKNFQIEGINTLNYTDLTLSFGLYCSTGTTNFPTVEISEDGTNYTALTCPAGSTTWSFKTCTGVIPATANLRIRFTQPNTTAQYRIDDVTLSGILAAAPLSASAVATNPNCSSGTGSITVTASGGTSPYTYSIDGTNFQASNIFSSLTSGNYTLTVKDATTATTTTSATVTIPTAISASAVATNPSCSTGTGSITVTASGGTGTLTYSKDGTNYQASNVFNSLAAGSYTITVKDANACTTTTSATVTIPTAISASAVATNPSCSTGTGTITVTASGGTGTLTYSKDGTNYQASNVFSSLSAGSYTITVKDANACTTTTSATVTIPTAISASAVATNPSCSTGTGSITVTASGGTGTLNYSKDGTNFQASNIFNTLSAGSYTITVKDANGCTTTTSATVTIPTAINISSLNVTDVSVASGNDGQIEVIASGGTGTLTYSKDGSNFQASNIFGSLSSGSYTLTVKDANACTTSGNAIVNEPSVLTLTVNSVKDITCNGGNDGEIDVVVSGGVSPYTYSKDGTNFQSSGVFSSLTANSYTITAKDNNGATKSQVIVVNDAAVLASSSTVTACETYNWYGTDYTTSGVKTHIVSSKLGCDSTLTLNLTINHATSFTDVQTACNSFTWIDGITYTSSNNTATHIIPNSVGCDSLITLNLTINVSTSSTTNVTNCGSYTWNGTTYTTSGLKTFNTTNSVGCDSIANLNLIIKNATSSTDEQTACNSFTWIDGITYTSNNNTATHIIPNSVGCDSLITLNLTINVSTSSTTNVTNCGSYTWNGTTYTTSGVKTFNTLNSVGCDSVATLNLTIKAIPVATIVQVDSTLSSVNTATSYQWLDCDAGNSAIVDEIYQDFFIPGSGNYAVKLTTNGCEATSDCYAVIPTSILNNNLKSEITIFPNPTTGILNVKFDNLNTNTKVSILDLTGKSIIVKEISFKTTFIEFDLSKYPKGVYLIKVTNEMKTKLEKIVIE